MLLVTVNTLWALSIISSDNPYLIGIFNGVVNISILVILIICCLNYHKNIIDPNLERLIPLTDRRFYEEKSNQTIELYKEIIDLNPENDEIWIRLCDIYVVNGEYDNTIKTALQALLKSPRNNNAWYYLGISYYLKGNKSLAIKLYNNRQRPFELQPYSDSNLIAAYCHLAYAYLITKNLEISKETCFKVLEIDPNNKTALRLLKDEEQKIIADYHSEELNKPKNAKDYYILAKLFYKARFYEQSLSACNHSVEINPNYKKAMNFRERILNKFHANNLIKS